MTPPATPSRRIELVFLALAALLITASLLPARFVRVRMVDDKLATMAAVEPFDVVFIGSSRIARQISPEIFERRLARRGHTVRSFNAGVGAMRIVESYSLLLRVVDDPALRPRYVLFEASGFFERIERANLSNSRTLYWHDVEASMLAARSVQFATDEEVSSVVQASRHVQAGALHALNIGTWSSHLASWLEVPQFFPPLTIEDGGYAPIPSDPAQWSPAQAQRRKAFVEKRDGFDRRVAKYADDLEGAFPIGGFAADVLRRIKDAARRHDVELIFLLAPQSLGGPRMVATVEHEGLGPLLDFSSPIAYPKLFAPHHRFDREHLNEEGSRLFSAYLGDAFANLLDGGAAP